MKLTNWKNIAELVGIAAIVASLIFVGMELQQQQQIAENEAGYNLQDSRHATRIAQIENADIWLRGNAGEELTPVEAAIYEQLIRISWSSAFWIARTQQGVGRDQNIAIHDFAGFLHSNPGARKVWEAVIAREQFYRQRLIHEAVGADFTNIVFSDLGLLGD